MTTLPRDTTASYDDWLLPDPAVSIRKTGRPRTIGWRILGDLRATIDGRDLPLGPPRQRELLAVLLAHAGEPTSVETLIEALWGGDAPAQALNVVHKHVGALRRLVDPVLPARAQGDWLTSSIGGYRIAADEGTLDLVDFRSRVLRARLAPDDRSALELLLGALDLWEGHAAVELRGTPVLDAVFSALEREYAVAVAEAAELAERAGQPHRVLPALALASDLVPTDERLHARFIRCLVSSGRRDEAERVAAGITDRLRDEVGVDPGPDLRAAENGLAPDASAPSMPVPAQLPADLRDFVGREEELSDLVALAPDPADPSAVAVIAGEAGVGKSALAVHAAARLAPDYPDGQLWVDLQGDDVVGALDPADVLGRFLTALDVRDADIPSDLAGRAALWRRSVSGRRLLVVLDNARDADQVIPLLPGGRGSLALVTGRAGLGGLAGATDRVLTPGLLDEEESMEYLARRLGDRIGIDPSGSHRLHRVSGGLPSSLTLLAARALLSPELPLGLLAGDADPLELTAA